MATQATLPEVFSDEEFWYELDVDFARCEESAADQLHEEAKEDNPELEEDELNISESDMQERLAGLLIERFTKRKRRVIRSHFDTVDEFQERALEGEGTRNLLRSIYVEDIWRKNQDGEVFTNQDEGPAIQDIISADTLVHEEVNEEFDLLWPGDPTIGKEVDDGEVIARRYFQTKPVVVRKRADGFEIRGAKKNRKPVLKRFRRTDDFEEQKPEPAEEQIVGKIQDILVADNNEFRLIGVDFAESELPENSRLRVKNERAIYEDLRQLSEENIVSIDGISEVSKLHLKDTRQGGKFRVELTHRLDGVEFELKTNHKLDDQRDRFRQGFTAVTGIEFGKIYEYGSQDEEYLFNRILAGRGEAYEKYYEELSEKIRNVLEAADEEGYTGGELISVSEETHKCCLECDEDEPNLDANSCDECGADDFSDPIDRTVVEVNDTSVATYLQNKLKHITPKHPKRSFSRWNIGDRKMAKRKIVTTSFGSTVGEGRSSKSDYHEVEVVPQGNNPRPGTVNNYLLKCIYITYGKSASADDEGYGRLSLYDIITSDSLDELVGIALHNAIVGVKDRLLTKSNEAHDEATEYWALVDELGSMAEHKDELEEIYDPDNDSYFEKHLFWLLKGIYGQTERWGRVGERETDGVLIIPEETASDYYVATYDAKLSHRKDGYDLGTSEEDQATRYTLEDAERDAIENKTGDRGHAAHMLISQNFDETDFPRVAGHVRENIDTYTDGENVRTRLVFMEFRAVVELYELVEEFWWGLRDTRIRKKFDSYVIEALEEEETVDNSPFVHFDSDSVSRIRERLISRLKQYDRERLEFHRG
jgi:hypothetical protein